MTLERLHHHIDARNVVPHGGEWFDTHNPFTAEAWAQVGRGDAADADAAVQAAHRAFSSGAWPSLTATLRGALLRRLADLIARDAKVLAETDGARQRQIARRDAGPAELSAAVVSLLRRLGGQDRRPRHPAGQEGLLQLHPARAARRGRRHHAVELAAVAAGLEDRTGARGRLHRGGETVGVHFGIDPAIRSVVRRGRLPARRVQRRHRIRPRGRFGPDRAPARGQDHLHRHPTSRVGRSTKPLRASSSTSASSWAENHPISSSPTPTWTTPSTVPSRASSPPRARPASPVRGCCCRTAFTTRWSNACWRWRAVPAWATRWRPTPRSAPSRLARNTTRC